MWPILTSAIMLGLVSSVHCVGMCGPLALSLPLSSLSTGTRFRALLLYHAGRLSVYAALGAVFGIFGRGIYLAGFQQLLSVVLGFVVVLAAIFTGMSPHVPWLARIRQPLNKLVFKLWSSGGRHRYVLLGMANGLLPCGMVYLAAAAALTFSNTAESIVFMLFFGAGTLPALLLLSSSAHLAGVRTRAVIRKAMPGVAALIGILLIFRGLDLGIPFLSPLLAHHPGQAVSCH